MKKYLFIFLILVVGETYAQNGFWAAYNRFFNPNSTIKLSQLETGKVASSPAAGLFGMTGTNGKQRYWSFVNANLVQLSINPTATGNNTNLNQFVTSANGTKGYIDWQGDFFTFPAGGGSITPINGIENITTPSAGTGLGGNLVKATNIDGSGFGFNMSNLGQFIFNSTNTGNTFPQVEIEGVGLSGSSRFMARNRTTNTGHRTEIGLLNTTTPDGQPAQLGADGAYIYSSDAANFLSNFSSVNIFPNLAQIASQSASSMRAFAVQPDGFYLHNLDSGTASDVLYFNPTTKKLSYGAGGGGGSYTFSNGLTNNPSGTVKLGGILSETTNISLNLAGTANLSLDPSTNTISTISGDGESEISANPNNIFLKGGAVKMKISGDPSVAVGNVLKVASLDGSNVATLEFAADLTSGGGGGSPSAPNGSIQYNSSGAFAGSPEMTWDEGESLLDVTNLSTNNIRLGYSTGSGSAVWRISGNVTMQSGINPEIKIIVNVGTTAATISAAASQTIAGSAQYILPAGKTAVFWFDEVVLGWQLVSTTEKAYKVSVSTPVTNSTNTSENITGFLTATLEVGKSYQIEMQGKYSSAATSTGAGFGWVFSGTGDVYGRSVYNSNAAGAAVCFSKAATTFTGGQTTGSATTENAVQMTVYVTPTTSGTLQFTFFSEVNTSAITFENGIIRVIEI